ncbi:hypothetical protein Q5688_31810 [Microcoleus sp. herbarium5]
MGVKKKSQDSEDFPVSTTLSGSYLRSPTSADIPTVMILSEGDRP